MRCAPLSPFLLAPPGPVVQLAAEKPLPSQPAPAKPANQN